MQPVVDVALAAIACAAGAVDWTLGKPSAALRHLAGADAERGARIAADLALRETQGPARMQRSRARRSCGARRGGRVRGRDRRAVAALEGPRGATPAPGPKLSAPVSRPGVGPANFLRPLGSREFQAARRFRELLRELATLGAVAPDLDAPEALAELRRLAAAPFQPESGEPAVFVLDAYDDPGVQFDSLWVAGLTATAWPRPVAVDPLLPIEIQRQLGMPGVTPEACVAEAQDIIARWRARADALVLSWPQFENDTEVGCSPLLPAEAATRAALAAADARTAAFDGATRTAAGGRVPPLATARSRAVHGSSNCRRMPVPRFCGTAARRAPLEEPQAGFDRRLRASCCIARCRISGPASAPSSARGARRDGAATRWRAAVDRRSRPSAAGNRPPHDRARTRMATPGDRASAGARPRAAAVFRASKPNARSLAIGGLELNLRVDRLDRIGDELVVIDYKTGKTRSARLARRAHGCAATAALRGAASGATDGHRLRRCRRGAARNTSASAATAAH